MRFITDINEQHFIELITLRYKISAETSMWNEGGDGHFQVATESLRDWVATEAHHYSNCTGVSFNDFFCFTCRPNELEATRWMSSK